VDASDYTQYRPLMFSIAYRMTGSVADAEDIVQEAFLRLAHGTEAVSPKAFVTTVTTRLAIDHLRSARVRRESYVGTWLPEPLARDASGALIVVIAFDVLDGQVQAIRAVANPDKLGHLGPVSRAWHRRAAGVTPAGPAAS
jgi:RNA polymerase sigma factor (sigma-70 family)